MGLELKVEQKQRVYQKQIEQARILQMNAQEIAVYIQEVALENPLIEVEELAEVKEALSKGGVGTGVCGPRVRTVTACQGSEVCPSGCIDTYTLAKELDERYFGRELPHKFKFGVTGCQNNCLKAEENDVGIKGGMNIEYKEDDCIPVVCV